MGKSYAIALVCLIIVASVFFTQSAQVDATGAAGYRKPPFNGSIFGKRSSAGTTTTTTFKQLGLIR